MAHVPMPQFSEEEMTNLATMMARVAADAAQTFYNSLLRKGFTPSEALDLTKAFLSRPTQ